MSPRPCAAPHGPSPETRPQLKDMKQFESNHGMPHLVPALPGTSETIHGLWLEGQHSAASPCKLMGS